MDELLQEVQAEKEYVLDTQRWFKDLWVRSESVKNQDLEKYMSSGCRFGVISGKANVLAIT